MRPLSGTSNILDIQETGYKNSIFAIAELVDNSIQANASKIDIIIINNTTVDKDSIDEVLVIDNGDGMELNVFEKALMFNSGTRSGSKTGLGKYGQGLPSASVSQTRRVEVYTKSKNGNLYYDHLDLMEIYKSGSPFLQDIEDVDCVKIPFIESFNEFNINISGTIVRWVKPNRLRPQNIKTLVDRINETAGRIFRYYINGFQKEGNKIECDINVLVYDYNNVIYSKNKFLSKGKIKVLDPLFLMAKSQMDDLFPNYEHPTSQLLAKTEESFSIEIEGPDGKIEKHETNVEIIFTYVKEKERYRFGGRNPGDTPLGKMYLKRNLYGSSGYDNISIVRANREIDAGNFGFIGDISASTNRWWSVEIKIEGALDHILGVDMKKQQASAIGFTMQIMMRTFIRYLNGYQSLLKIVLLLFRVKLKSKSIQHPQNPEEVAVSGLPLQSHVRQTKNLNHQIILIKKIYINGSKKDFKI